MVTRTVLERLMGKQKAARKSWSLIHVVTILLSQKWKTDDAITKDHRGPMAASKECCRPIHVTLASWYEHTENACIFTYIWRCTCLFHVYSYIKILNPLIERLIVSRCLRLYKMLLKCDMMDIRLSSNSCNFTLEKHFSIEVLICQAREKVVKGYVTK